MPDPLTFSLDGVDEVFARATVELARVRAAAMTALGDEGEAIMTRSKEEFVPVDEGILRASGTVKYIEHGTQEVVELAYGGAAAPYALSVHENPRAGKTGGITPSGYQRETWATVGQWKYLEQPFLESASGMLERLVARIRLRVGFS